MISNQRAEVRGQRAEVSGWGTAELVGLAHDRDQRSAVRGQPIGYGAGGWAGARQWSERQNLTTIELQNHSNRHSQPVRRSMVHGLWSRSRSQLTGYAGCGWAGARQRSAVSLPRRSLGEGGRSERRAGVPAGSPVRGGIRSRDAPRPIVPRAATHRMPPRSIRAHPRNPRWKKAEIPARWLGIAVVRSSDRLPCVLVTVDCPAC